MPTWLLAAGVVLALAGAGWLFWHDGTDGPRPAQEARDPRDRAEDLLTVPDASKGDGSAGSRRGEQGRERLDAGRRDDDAEAPDPPGDGPRSDDEPLPPILARLEGVRVGLAPATAAAATGASRQVTIGGLRVRCAPPAGAPALERELAVLTALEQVLARAGATVVDVADEHGVAPCVDGRVRQLETADLALVIRAGTPGRVRPGRAPRPLPPPQQRAARLLAADVAGALEFRQPAARASRAELRELAAAGALDLPSGAHVALVVLPAGASARTDETALAIARGLALAATRLPAR